MPEAVQQTRAVAGLLVQNLAQVIGNLARVIPFLDVRLDLGHLIHHPPVGAAVAGAFERERRGGQHAVGVGVSRGDDVRRERGVVAAAVVGVKNEAQIQQIRLQPGVLGVFADHHQKAFGRGFAVLGVAQEQALAQVVMGLDLIGIGRHHRVAGDQVDALPQYVGERDVVGLVVVDVRGQNGPRQAVHDVLAGRADDRCFLEAIGQPPRRV